MTPKIKNLIVEVVAWVLLIVIFTAIIIIIKNLC
jgi:hypothetical protein